ncbi:MAG: hypothetical protein AAF721_35335 [Myxococcota bacterium]
MSAHAAAIEALADAVRGFVRRPECRLLHVVAPGPLRRGALQTVMAAEHAPENRSAFVRLDEPYATAAPAWTVRSAAAREQHEQRRDGAESTVPELPEPPQDPNPLVAFAQQLWQLLSCPPQHSGGLVVVLAPAQVEAPANWMRDVARLVEGPSLRGARFVVLDRDVSTVDALVAKLGPAAKTVAMRLPESAGTDALEASVAGNDGAGPSGVAPPARAEAHEEPAPSRQAEQRTKIGAKIVAAAQAIGAGDAVASVTAQREARDLCRAAGFADDAAQMELVLGGHLMAAGQPQAAEASFASALAAAREAEAPDKVATAGFAVAAVRMAGGQRHTALVAYAEAAVAAEQSGEPMLAIEGNRLAGQAAADIKMEPQAITFFTRALKLAESAPAEVLPRTSAAQAARGLAAICRKRRLSARATELMDQAARFEMPSAPPAAEVPLEPDATAVGDFTPPTPRPPDTAAPQDTPSLSGGAPPEPGLAPGAADVTASSPSAGPVLFAEDRPNVPAPADAREPFAADASLPPPDLLGPAPTFAEPDLLEPAMAPARPPMLVAADFGNQTPEDFGEGTSMLTLEEIAEMHWGGAAEAGARPWSPEEIDVLQRAVNEALEPEATLMLSRDELSALRGERVEPAGPPPEPPPPVDDGVIAGLEAVDAPSTPLPAKSSDGAFNPDEVTMFSLDEVTEMRRAMSKGKRGDDDDPSEG